MTTRLVGPVRWGLSRTNEFHREYSLVSRVECTSVRDGPHAVLNTPGLFLPGAYWHVFDDIDPWALCKGDATVRSVIDREKNVHWEVEQKFSTAPDEEGQGAGQGPGDDSEKEDPLSEPPKVSGSFVKYSREATHDRFGSPLKYSSHEQMRGGQVEFDANRASVRVQRNQISLSLSAITAAMDHVNSSSMWGVGPRCVKLSGCQWERKYHGKEYIYYDVTLEFDIQFDTFDRDVLDEGTKVINGRWEKAGEDAGWKLVNIAGAAPDFRNPTHFIRAVDRKNNPIRALLNGSGFPLTDSEDPQYIHVEYYQETNLFGLGVPAIL